ncbi:uncharacterized protein [Primulina eburnea]|uniref:uncharacterized protein n=1 Tax=Primulina eburnea TaxID=1245227 RepID=UPI003C6CB7FF
MELNSEDDAEPSVKDAQNPKPDIPLVEPVFQIQDIPEPEVDIPEPATTLAEHDPNPSNQGEISLNPFFGENLTLHLLSLIYVDDIIFGLTSPELCAKFSKLMQEQFEMSMMGELTFFLILQIKHLDTGNHADYAGGKLNRKSTSGFCQFLGDRLISWFSKKHTSTSTPTSEAEYLAAGSCYSQILWMQQQLEDY